MTDRAMNHKHGKDSFESIPLERHRILGLSFRSARDGLQHPAARDAGDRAAPDRKLEAWVVYVQKIQQDSFQSYFEKFFVPYREVRCLPSPTAREWDEADHRRTYQAGLHANSELRMIVNQNDFLLDDYDLTWLRSVFGPNQLTDFEQARHAGIPSYLTVQ